MWVWCPVFVVNRHSLSGLSPGGTGSGRWLRVARGANKSVNGLHLELKIWVSRVKFGILIRVPTKPGIWMWAKGGTTNVLSTPPSGLLLGPFLSECQESGSYPCLRKETYHTAHRLPDASIEASRTHSNGCLSSGVSYSWVLFPT